MWVRMVHVAVDAEPVQILLRTSARRRTKFARVFSSIPTWSASRPPSEVGRSVIHQREDATAGEAVPVGEARGTVKAQRPPRHYLAAVLRNPLRLVAPRTAMHLQTSGRRPSPFNVHDGCPHLMELLRRLWCQINSYRLTSPLGSGPNRGALPICPRYRSSWFGRNAIFSAPHGTRRARWPTALHACRGRCAHPARPDAGTRT